MRHNIGPISANSRLLLLDQWRRLHRSSAGLTTAALVDCLNLPTFGRNLALYRPYTKPIVTFTMASSSKSRKARVQPMNGTLLGPLLCRKQVLATRVCARIGCQMHTEVIIPETAQYWQPIFGKNFADAGPVLGRI